MSSVDNYYITVLNSFMNYFEQCIVPILYIFGNIGNVFSAFIFAKRSWRKNVCVFYFNTCLVFNTGYINSAILAAVLSNFEINLYDSNNILCKLFFYTVFVFSTLTPTVLILASIDRLLISSQNIETRLYSSKRLGYFSVSISTVFWIVFLLHVLIKVHVQEIYPFYFICYYDISQFYLQFISYSLLVTNSSFCFFMIILCMIAFKQVRRIRAIPSQQQRQQIRTMNKKDFQLLRCLFVHDIVYIIFSMSLTIFTVYQAITIYQVLTPLEQSIINICNRFCILLHHVAYCPSFYIFITISKCFRNEFKRLVYKTFRKDITLIREEENIGRETKNLDVAVINPLQSLN